MPFVKGQSGNPKGGPREPRKATKNAREAIARLVDDNAERMQGWLDEIARDQGAQAAWKCLMDVVEYHIPKLQRTEHAGDPNSPVEHRHVVIEHVSSPRTVS